MLTDNSDSNESEAESERQPIKAQYVHPKGKDKRGINIIANVHYDLYIY